MTPEVAARLQRTRPGVQRSEGSEVSSMLPADGDTELTTAVTCGSVVMLSASSQLFLGEVGVHHSHVKQ